MIRGSRRPAGLTLVECLIAAALLAALATLAVPTLAGLRSRAELRAAVTTLRLTLHRARAAALANGVAHSVCVSVDGERCAAAGNRLLLFADPATPGVRSAAEPLVGVHALPGRLRVTATRPAATWFADPRAAQTVTFTLCVPGGAAPSRQVVVSATGRIRVAADATSTPPPAACP